MNWVTTNIRFPEDQYMQLKQKAAKERKSLAKVIREGLAKVTKPQETDLERKKKVEKFMKEIEKLAEENSKHVPKGFDSTKALREIRYQEE